MESPSSANCGSSASNGEGPPNPLFWDCRNDDLEEARRGVVGLDTGDRDLALDGWRACDME
jgi:hypothetical protein